MEEALGLHWDFVGLIEIVDIRFRPRFCRNLGIVQLFELQHRGLLMHIPSHIYSTETQQIPTLCCDFARRSLGAWEHHGSSPQAVAGAALVLTGKNLALLVPIVAVIFLNCSMF